MPYFVQTAIGLVACDAGDVLKFKGNPMEAHTSDCAVNNSPVLEPGPCDCTGSDDLQQAERATQASNYDLSVRMMALECSIKFDNGVEVDYAVDTAKIFESYLRGETKAEDEPAA